MVGLSKLFITEVADVDAATVNVVSFGMGAGVGDGTGSMTIVEALTRAGGTCFTREDLEEPAKEESKFSVSKAQLF